MSAPLTPAECDLRDFPRMMVDIPRLFSSEFDTRSSDTEWRFGMTLWLKSFHHVPAASLPDDDVYLAKMCGLGRDVKSWRKAKAGALRGWIKCNDGLLYHPVVAEIALEAWLDKLLQRLSSGAGNAARWKVEFDTAPIDAEIGIAAALLASLNPKSRMLSKQRVATSLKDSQRDHSGVPPGIPPGRNNVPPASQGKGREEKKDTVSNETDAGASSQEPPAEGDPIGEMRALPLAKGCWRLTVKVLTDRGKLTDPKARAFVGKLKAAGLSDADLWSIAEDAWTCGTLDPVPYLTAAAERITAAAKSALIVAPTEARQRSWAADWIEKGRSGWLDHLRGPPPGAPGCQISAAILTELGVSSADHQHLAAA